MTTKKNQNNASVTNVNAVNMSKEKIKPNIVLNKNYKNWPLGLLLTECKNTFKQKGYEVKTFNDFNIIWTDKET